MRVGTIRVIETHLESDTRMKEAEPLCLKADRPGPDGEEGSILNLYDQVQYQEVLGFGGAFTESTALNFEELSPELQKQVLELYFDREKGIGYSFCRSTIGSCDFSASFYSYDDVDGDHEMEHFDISHDREAILPLIRRAREWAPELQLFASPWSPPAWMKTNGKMSKGGKLKPECRRAWALYLAKYLQAYEKEGVKLYGITVQNEAKAEQGWESCYYSASDEKDFVVNYLRPAMAEIGVNDRKVFFWDHNKERVVDRALETLDLAEDFFDGVAVHWYSGDHFSALEVMHSLFPDKLIISSEQCTGAGKTLWESGEKYAHDIIGNLNNWASAWVDWNMLLDEKGCPDHWMDEQKEMGLPPEKIWVGESPIVYDREKKELDIRSSYYYMGHFSRYIRPGARRIGSSVYDSRIETCAFRNPDGSLVCVALNRTPEDKLIRLRFRGKLAETTLRGHSICTFVLEEAE